MRERFFEQGERVNKKVEAINRELSDSGISHPSEWRKAVDLETPIDEAEEKFMTPERRNFDKIISYLEGDKKLPEKEKIEQYNETKDSIERLEILRTMSFGDAVAAIRDYAETDGSYKYLAGRLDFYQKLIAGEATRRQTEQEWDSQKGEYVNIEKEYPIDASSASPETIRVGLLRDIEFASMKGTPELAIYQITEKRLKASNARTKHLLPALKGFNSGIGIDAGGGRWLTRHLWLNLENSDDRAQSERIGYGYTFLRKTFEESKELVAKRYKGDEPLDEKTLEHRAVIQAANWLEEATNYNDLHRPLGSPYIGSVQESIAWARLGDPNVKKQIRGMRVKIQESDLRNIGRFIGKSGINRYDGERKRLFGQIKFFQEGDENTKQEFTTKENGFAVKKQEQWLARETDKINRWLEKSKAKIVTYDIPDSEKQEILANVQGRYEEKLAEITRDCQGEVERLSQRSPDQLLGALQERQQVVGQRYEKRKSLAQKALDLHFALNHEGGDYGSKPLGGLVDWINYAPLGTIKRSHRLLKQGANEEQVVTRALVDIITGAREATPEDMMTVQALVQKAKGQDHGAQQKLSGMSKVGNILSRFDYEVSLAEIENLATKQFQGMTEALELYDLDQVKIFMDRNINLQSVTSARKITEKFGHDLSPDVIAEIASHDINGLEGSLRAFDLDSVVTLLRQDVNLPVAVAVLNNTRQFGYELSIAQIASIAKNVQDIEDFTSALRELPLAEVERLFTIGVPYREFSTVKAALEKHGLSSDFNASLSVAQKLIKHREFDSLDRALDFYSLAEIDQIIAKDVTLGNVLSVREVLEQKSVETTLQETIEFSKNGGDHYNSSYYIGQAIDTFGIESVRKIVTKSCPLYKAIEVNNYINSNDNRSRYGSNDTEMSESLRESLKKGGLDVVIAIGRAGNMEAAVKTVEAGFTVDEITRFPFLISPLVTRK